MDDAACDECARAPSDEPSKRCCNLCAERALKSRIPVGLSLWIESWTSAKLRYFDRLFWVPATRLGPKRIRSWRELTRRLESACSSQQIDFLDRAGACSDACRGRAGEPSITLAQISPRVRPPRDMPTTTERLRARWARTGRAPRSRRSFARRRRSSRVESARAVERSRARDAPERRRDDATRGFGASRAGNHAPPSTRRATSWRKRDARRLATPPDATRDARRRSATRPLATRALPIPTTTSSARRPAGRGQPPDATDARPDHLDPADPIVRLKNDANDALRRGDHDLAPPRCGDRALDALRVAMTKDDGAAVDALDSRSSDSRSSDSRSSDSRSSDSRRTSRSSCASLASRGVAE